MVLFELSVLIVAISYLCYCYPELIWSVTKELGISVRKDNGNVQPLKPGKPPQRSPKVIEKKLTEKHENEKALVSVMTSELTKHDTDRNLMPPPPLPISASTSRNEGSSATTELPKNSSNKSMKPPSNQRSESVQRVGKNNLLELGLPRLPTAPLRDSSLRTEDRSRPGLHVSSNPPLPNRTPLNLSPLTGSSTSAKPGSKVLLAPGHSPLDWARLMNSNALFSFLPPGAPYLKIPPSRLKNYTGRGGKDAWTILSGKVYNITPYLPFHPGGEPELLRCAGRDGTKLFTEVHPWVNWEGMLAKCLVGVAVQEDETYTRN